MSFNNLNELNKYVGERERERKRSGIDSLIKKKESRARF
jgi:hypothetical protein